MRKKRYDKIFLLTVFLMFVAGFFILLSASMGLLTKESSNFSKIILKQGIIGFGAGSILFLLCSKLYYKNWRKLALPFFLASFILSFLVFIPHIGFEYGGARRWINLGPLTFQPSELLKIFFIIYLASWIVSRKDDIRSFKFGLLPFLVMTAFVGFILIAEPDIGTLGVIALASGCLFLIGGGKLGQVAVIFFLGMALLGVLILIKPHAMSRITVFLHPSHDPQGIGYQMRQSLIAVGSGGLFGRGFGMSIQKFNYLPQPIGDSIFAVFAEEFGFVGSIALMALFLFFLYRGFKIAMDASDPFAKLLASGIVILIVVQSFINIASIIGIIPLTGLPLIFVSQGGTALAIALASTGILLNISKNS